jgi:hypothetical protein
MKRAHYEMWTDLYTGSCFFASRITCLVFVVPAYYSKPIESKFPIRTVPFKNGRRNTGILSFSETTVVPPYWIFKTCTRVPVLLFILIYCERGENSLFCSLTDSTSSPGLNDIQIVWKAQKSLTALLCTLATYVLSCFTRNRNDCL